ncbi:tyrosine-type recombinase/integrase [Paraeggerthella sp.]|uniref:tyrosine-type recombinase/integrase n=1 Tax=Paraeggerthella sp. TaxID=2897350 RepID=UPI003AB5316C
MLPKCSSDFQPYIFTHAEIQELARIFDAIPYDKRYPDRHLVVPMLFRTLYGCGLRLGEALNLAACDVDMRDDVLAIRHAKGGEEPLRPHVQVACSRVRAVLGKHAVCRRAG